MKYLLLSFILLASVSQGATQQKQVPAKQVLVVLSSESKLTLRDGIVHSTGFFLSELMIPVLKLRAAGFRPVFANPRGNEPVMDKISDNAMWFGGDQARYQQVRNSLLELPGLKHPLTLAQVRNSDLSQFAAIFVPGGHAPMEDLLTDPDMGALLKYFHNAHKPTALICHGPIALLSTLDNPEKFTALLAERSAIEAAVQNEAAGARDQAKMKEWESQSAQLTAQLAMLTQNWPYKGYELTAFSTKEEQQEEATGQDGVLGGFVKFYPDEALGAAGASSLVQAVKWTGNVRKDRELITGQNPFSDQLVAQALVQALQNQK